MAKERGRAMAPELVQLVVLYLMAVNLAAFFLMGVDKRRAVGKKWRISEKTLFLPAVLGGALGGLLGMRFFHHKTRHWYFRWGFPLPVSYTHLVPREIIFPLVKIFSLVLLFS